MPTKLQHKDNLLVGVISDTHGVLRPSAVQVFQEADLIVHAGDIGRPEVLEDLARIAPVVAVRGNVDYYDWARELPEVEIVEAGQVLLYTLHDLQKLDLDPAAAGFHAVINGHTHRPAAEKRNGVLYLNPGSAAEGRFDSPTSVALLRVRGTALVPQFVELKN